MAETQSTNLKLDLVDGDSLFDTNKVKSNFEKIDTAVGSLTEKALKIRVKKSLSTGEWQGSNTVKSIDTGIDYMTNDIPVIYSNNSANSSKLTFIPCLKDNHWYISSNCSFPEATEPDSIMFIVLNV